MSNSILDQFGIGKMPWIMRVYLLLFLSSIGLLIVPGLTFFKFSPEAQSKIIVIGMDLIKIVTGAVIGSLSIAAQKEWGKPNA